MRQGKLRSLREVFCISFCPLMEMILTTANLLSFSSLQSRVTRIASE